MTLVPKKAFSMYKKHFIRSYFTVLFTKVPAEIGRETWFNFNIKANTDFPLASMDFRKVKMTTEGYTGIRNNLSTSCCKKLIDKDSSLNLNITVS